MLAEGAVTSAEPQHFGVVLPGLWERDVPHTAADLGLTDVEVDAAITEFGLPIEKQKPAAAASARAKRKPAADEGGD